MTSTNYSSGNDRFNTEAQTWDTQAEVVESSSRCLSHLVSSPLLPPSQLSQLDALEIGCGTGLLTLPLSGHVSSILALDTSHGMVEMLDHKLESRRADAAKSGRVTAKVKLLEDATDPVLEGKRFGLVLSHLVMHHVPHMQHLVDVMYACTAHGGRVWISDFENTGKEAEAFHPVAKHAGVERHGLERQEMRDILAKAGYANVDVFESFRLDKTVESGQTQSFPFIVATGTRE
ncbi:uncharacterized protein PFL1_05332 [Pseudozyma flocculosa PF-1]|uniref:Related to phosphoethanolamine N-methyltransferase n=2 Tax=Pseudozyma flocculosa TaxID=84751 RepID=A0A5C3FEJ8_9BASI|nr:uncharacterized protein PFL1_05332 [Pseudozyma flocculosa PF-1]EPQ27048.1 hypothetical protein PFL1_05332 [Pseudozyma flocculosa PF-1]SPO42125.1 related to phosphoethanolamine N-methyltransferase [Pseudozyma flocculosa]